MVSFGFTCVHLGSLGFIWVHLYSPGFTWVHLGIWLYYQKLTYEAFLTKKWTNFLHQEILSDLITWCNVNANANAIANLSTVFERHLHYWYLEKPLIY